MSCGCNSSNQSPCVPTPTVHLSNCEGCVYTVNSDCVIYNGDRLDFEPSTVINGSVRTLTTLMELFPTCNFHTDCIYFDGEPFSFEGELDEPYPSRTLTDLLNSIGLSITDIESDITTIQSDITTLQSSSGLQYFIESLDSVNNIHSLVPDNSAANASILIEPKGNGSFKLHSASNASGTNSVNLGRSAFTTGISSFTAGLGNISQGQYSVSLGFSSFAGDANAVAIGFNNQANGPYSIATGASTRVESLGGEAGGLNSRSVYISERTFGYSGDNDVSPITSDRVVYFNTLSSNNQPFDIRFARGIVVYGNLKPQLYVNSANHPNPLNYTNGVWFCELNLSLIVMTAQSGFNLYDSYYTKRMFTYKVIGGTASIEAAVQTIGANVASPSMIDPLAPTTISITATVANDLKIEVTPPSTLAASSNLRATGYVRMIQVL